MKIVHILPTRNIGGAERMVEELVSRLPRSWGASIVTVLRPGGKLTISAIRSAAARAARARPTLVHGHLFGAGELSAHLAARRLDVPYVITVHGFDEHGKVKSALRSYARRGAARIVAVSDALRDYVIKNDRVRSDRVVTIPNGIDTKKFPPPVRQGEDEGGGFVIVAVGRLVPEKAYDVMLRALARVREFDWQCRIAGDGPEKARLKKLAKDLRISDRVKFLGALKKVASMLASADVFVHPSKSEGHGRAILEAMAASLPVIATSVGGTPEAIENGVTGLLVRSGDFAALAAAIRRVHDDQPLARALGSAARAVVTKKFSIERMVSSYKKLYEDIAGS